MRGPSQQYYSTEQYYPYPPEYYSQPQQTEAPGGALSGIGTQVAGKAIAKKIASMFSGGGSAASGGTIEGGVGTAANGGTMMADGSIVGGSGPMSLSGIGASGNLLLPAAGALGAYDLFSKKKHGGKGALQGAASGAAIGSYAGLPGAIVGGLVGGGLGYFGNFGDVDRWKAEQDAVNRFAKDGVTGWDQYAAAQPQLSEGRSKEQLTNHNYGADFVGSTSDGWVNNKFANSRNEKDLQGKDIWGYSAFGDAFGNDWFGKYDAGQREKIANKALELGVTEGKGQIKLTNVDQLKNYASELSKALQGGKKR